MQLVNLQLSAGGFDLATGRYYSINPILYWKEMYFNCAVVEKAIQAILAP